MRHTVLYQVKNRINTEREISKAITNSVNQFFGEKCWELSSLFSSSWSRWIKSRYLVSISIMKKRARDASISLKLHIDKLQKEGIFRRRHRDSRMIRLVEQRVLKVMQLICWEPGDSSQWERSDVSEHITHHMSRCHMSRRASHSHLWLIAVSLLSVHSPMVTPTLGSLSLVTSPHAHIHSEHQGLLHRISELFQIMSVETVRRNSK